MTAQKLRHDEDREPTKRELEEEFADIELIHSPNEQPEERE